MAEKPVSLLTSLVYLSIFPQGEDDIAWVCSMILFSPQTQHAASWALQTVCLSVPFLLVSGVSCRQLCQLMYKDVT